MKDGPNIVRIAALVGDHARADVLTALMTDRALTATELADVAGVTKQTISGHLAKLLDAGLVAVDAQGRHRYYRLADRDVAHLLESLMGVAFRTGAVRLRASPREPALRHARACYDHLAGEMGVILFEGLLRRRALAPVASARSEVTLTTHGQSLMRGIGIDSAVVAARRRIFCRPCLDWSERRHHLAGALGAALLERLIALRWATRNAQSRVVTFSQAGEKALRQFAGTGDAPVAAARSQ